MKFTRFCENAVLLLGACLALTVIFQSTVARANFLDTVWKVAEFKGEAWYLSPADYLGQSQEFYKGFAEGIFFSCDGGGLSKTYTEYAKADFLNNPEFSKYFKDIEFDDDVIYVHRLSCEKSRNILYPFVTTGKRQRAYYLFEGGVFLLTAE